MCQEDNNGTRQGVVHLFLDGVTLLFFLLTVIQNSYVKDVASPIQQTAGQSWQHLKNQKTGFRGWVNGGTFIFLKHTSEMGGTAC